ncbi:putative metalloprotease with PDZ domain [Brevundimonas nasdae]|uniref:M61 family metallopeptidase n=1 Tax=Brevundimonas nasdae TaxID=172043 RepID=UPI001913D5AA|nr:M61 family metallopeptidase [Brevundimonas nasdae]MBK6026210.1 M61 family metallopeptidase [Brevundimonas nasdae]MDQ0452859.1 putative metalloprotease with PDZ domain [Brevundimonas nasdae]
MSRSRLPAACLALLLTGAAVPALAHSFQSTPIIADATQAPLALPRAQPAIPVPQDRPYPGVIQYRADVTDVDRRIVNVTQTIPVAQAGPLTLLYPKYLPGNHAATGPIQLISGLTVTANGQRIEWLRDTLDPYAFHLDIPAGVTSIDVAFQWLTQPDNSNWRVTMTPALVNLQWEKAILYPAGHYSRQIQVAPSIVLPSGWQYGTALATAAREGDVARFETTDLYTLIDSPVFAGAHYRRVDIDPTGDRVHLNILADEAKGLAATDDQIKLFKNMVQQADRLFGARHFDRYEFLFALTNQLGGIGLEHHRSSENTGAPDFFTNWSKSEGDRGLLPHEYTHSWNGKFMRPADELTANHNVPTQNTLLWVYEGQTEYWGDVLAARAGLHSREVALATLAAIAAFYDNQPGREWRALQDVNNHNLLGYRVPGQFTSWMRGTGDYYRESALIWLDADTLIREGTNNRKSLDDFARAFFGHDDGQWAPQGYTFEQVVAALNAVYPHDWTGFLRGRLDAVGPDAHAPLAGITRGGYRLTYTDTPSAAEKAVQTGWANDFQYSLGFTLSGDRLTNIRWGGPAFEQRIGAGWQLVAVNGVAGSAEALRNAVTAAKGTDAKIELLIKSGDRFRTVAFDYHDGLRYPRLERIEGTPDRLGAILTPRSR